jgi:hypothetical protein
MSNLSDEAGASALLLSVECAIIEGQYERRSRAATPTALSLTSLKERDSNVY